MIESRADLCAPGERWAAFERQLYEIGVSNVSLYKETLVAVRRLADGLNHIDGREQLDAAWSMAMQDDTAIPLPVVLPKEQVLGAAFALRAREIRERDVRRTRQSRIDEARRAGSTWVALEGTENVDPESAAGLQGIEMHVATGLAIISMVQRNPLDGAVVFVASIARLDSVSGEMIEIAPGAEGWNEHMTREAFLKCKAVLRARIEATRIG